MTNGKEGSRHNIANETESSASNEFIPREGKPVKVHWPVVKLTISPPQLVEVWVA
jgi:hypothetical protein